MKLNQNTYHTFGHISSEKKVCRCGYD